LRSALAFIFLLVSTVSTSALADCPLDLGRGTGWVVFSDQYMIAFRPEPMRIDVGQPFALLLNVCTRKGNPAELVAIEAQIEEGRPMKVKAALVSTGEGRYRAEDLVLDAPGRWELNIDVRAGGDSERLSHEIIVK
jgi:hypothetical protein